MKVSGDQEDVAGAVMPKLDEADLQAICASWVRLIEG
jgi:hypothetical protein